MLPAFAIMIAEFFNQHMLDSPKWYIVFDKILTTLFIVATIAAIIPFFAWELIEKQLDYPPFNPPQIVSWQFLAVSVTIGVMIFYLTRKKEKNIVINMSCLAAFAFIAILTILPYFAEGKKNMELTLKPFIERIDIEDRAQIAGWIFSETMLSGFYMYFDWSMPQLIKSDPETFAMTMDNERLKNIINGDDPTYKYVILERTKEEDIAKILGNNNYQILVDRNKIQRYKRNLILIEGTE
jgi:hypothetical protein